MSSNIFKISAVAATIAASFTANAALYNVYMEAPEGVSSSLQTYGVAISPETAVCWSTSCGEGVSKMATEVKSYREGWNYRDESPFFLPFGWTYLDDNWDGFRSYCYRYLGYSDVLCERWATQQYTNGYAKEQGGNYDGSRAYLDEVSLSFSENTVVNSINAANAPVGNARNGGTYRNLGYIDATSDTPSGSDFLSSHYWVSKELTTAAGSQTFTVGSITRNNVDTGSTYIFTSKPTVWLSGTATEISWKGGSANGDFRAQGSVRDVIVDSSDNSKVYAVGYTSDGDVRLKASVFKATYSAPNWSWDTGTLVSGFPYDSDRYANQTLKAVNDNKIAIGTAKLSEPLSGAYANSLFYVSDLDSPVYKEFSGSIFFTGANGIAGNINNHNDVVGTIDYDQYSETNGKPRGQRAFITNLGTTSGSAPLGGQARYLDDLTYGSGASTDNNQFRIVQAADINDAGVIAASAYYCAGGFDSEAIDASCSAGASLVGVKLVPINGQDSTDITTRPATEVTVERQGGALGLFVLTLLGLVGFRRK
ncbi:hypothetical protein TW81_13560 [Vibrio galatheae]|uniref:GlyGly-CTERM sorting domain-containing protein n=1 Tax=Vibrio galatheae TaxID=579748 RepID=A0A0F4NHN7_9VIBR|nr:DUF3466 family protein [Vibrio galatheae]KJY82434.1 hypothetical protein TW81_13560 [Vibrio galatheae]